MTETRGTAGRATGTARADAGTRSAEPLRAERALLLLPVGLIAFGAGVLGWSTRDEYYLVPSEGIGYALGIGGLAMMLLLLLYSLRKRWSPLARAGSIQRWFHVHMALGILGPTAILLHSNFHLGSLNANVALACMLVVSLSGIVGRFIYTRVHYGYMGRVATIEELERDARSGSHAFAQALEKAPGLDAILAEFRAHCLTEAGGAFARTWRFLTLGHCSRVARRKARRACRQASRDLTADGSLELGDVQRAVRRNLRALRRVGEYAAYERAFALWHAFHLPFCVVLFVAAGVHVVAVHMY